MRPCGIRSGPSRMRVRTRTRSVAESSASVRPGPPTSRASSSTTSISTAASRRRPRLHYLAILIDLASRSTPCGLAQARHHPGERGRPQLSPAGAPRLLDAIRPSTPTVARRTPWWHGRAWSKLAPQRPSGASDAEHRAQSVRAPSTERRHRDERRAHRGARDRRSRAHTCRIISGNVPSVRERFHEVRHRLPLSGLCFVELRDDRLRDAGESARMLRLLDMLANLPPGDVARENAPPARAARMSQRTVENPARCDAVGLPPSASNRTRVRRRGRRRTFATARTAPRRRSSPSPFRRASVAPLR
jgi:hypothetical protein